MHETTKIGDGTK